MRMSDLRIFETDIQRGSPENLAFSNITRCRMAKMSDVSRSSRTRRIASPENMDSLKVLYNYLLFDAA